MESKNSFIKGINQDLNFSIPQNDSYQSATNFHLVTNEGGTSFALENVKGNSLTQAIPSTSDVYEFYLSQFDIDILNEIPATVPIIQIDVDAVSETYVASGNVNYLEYLNELIVFINSTSSLQLIATLSDDESKILVHSTTLVDYTFDVTDLSTYFSTDFTVNLVVPSIAAPKIIGWETIREKIFIFTTDSTSSTPTNTSGQIWKFLYNQVTGIATSLELIYNNIINFSTHYGIANPGMIVGRYENENVQKLYWTNNYNQPKFINTADANVFGISPDKLNITPNVNLNQPILQNVIQAGNLKHGVYQIAYRLKNNSGAETTFSPLSALTHIVNTSEQINTIDLYMGCVTDGITTSDKSLVYKMIDLEGTYDRIEIVKVYYSSPTDDPELSIVYDIVVPINREVIVTITGNELEIPITLSEFTSFNITVDKVKTMATKDNILFLGNVTTNTFDVDFDARTYRFPLTAANTGSTSTVVLDQYGNTETIDTLYTLPEEHDCIQDYDSQAPNPTAFSQKYLYQAGTTVLGGSGLNITYKFTTPDSGTYPESVVFLDGTIKTTYSKVPHISLNKDSTTYDLNVPNQTFPHVNTFRNSGSPYLSCTLKGYKRDEMYRFGIVFYDLTGNPGFVKWIGDIRFPHIYMPDTTSATPTDRTLQFNFSSFTTPNCYGYNMGIEFTVDVSSIATQISGYSIVRVERTSDDKHILGQGQFYPAYVDGSSEVYLVGRNAYNEAYTGFGVDYTGSLGSIQSPDFLFNGYPGLQNNDKIDIVGVMENTHSIQQWNDTISAASPDCIVTKNYTLNATLPLAITQLTLNDNPFVITDSKVIENYSVAPTSFLMGSVNCNNKSYSTDTGWGGRTLCIEYVSANNNIGTGGSSEWPKTGNDDIETSYQMYLVNYLRVVTTQYGGNSFEAKSRNVYISCNNFVEVHPLSTTSTFTVFGGDTYISLFDNNKLLKGGDPTVTNSVKIFPCESSVNIPLRYSTIDNRIPNKRDFDDDFLTEDLEYNNVFSIDNKLKTYYPKPSPYYPVNKFDVHIRNSQTKINGELLDSWTIFKSTDYIEADTAFGEITSLQVLKNFLIFLQEKAVGIASVNDREVVTLNSGNTVGLGSGGILPRLDYIDTTSGCNTHFGITKNKESLFFFDSMDKQIKLLTNTNNDLSIIKGLSAFFNNNVTVNMLVNTPFKSQGLTATYDNRFKSVIFTFLDGANSFTISYNTLTGSFTNFYSFTPTVYINDGYNYFTPSEAQELYIHNKGNYNMFYDVESPSKLTILVNPNTLIKILDNLKIYTDAQNASGINIYNNTLTRIRVRTQRQNTDFQDISTLGKHKENMWDIKIPTDRVDDSLVQDVNIYTDLSPTRILNGKRMRNQWFLIDFEYDNPSNYHLVVHYIESLFRESIR